MIYGQVMAKIRHGGGSRTVVFRPFWEVVRCGLSFLAVKMERYGHGGYLIKVVVMALAGEVTLELSPILSWSNNNYKI